MLGNVQSCVKITFVLAWCVISTVVGINCSYQLEKQTNTNLTPEHVDPNNTGIGHQVGSTSPDFTIRLINGETISSAGLRKDSMPIFFSLVPIEPLVVLSYSA